MTSAVNPWEIESQPIVTYCPARHICLILFGRTVAPLVVVMEERSPPGAYDGIRGPAGPAILPIHERSEYTPVSIIAQKVRSPLPSAAPDRCLGPACTPCRRASQTPSPPTRIATSRGDAAAYDGPAGRARD